MQNENSWDYETIAANVDVCRELYELTILEVYSKVLIMSASNSRRGSTIKNKNSNKRKCNQSYFVDRSFLPRVKEYLEVQKEEFDADDVVDYLQSRYHEYSRKKRNVLRLSVEKAIETLGPRSKKNDDEQQQSDRTSALEERYLKKRQKRSKSLEKATEIEISSDDSFEESEEELLLYKDTNAINNSMQNLYRSQSRSTSRNATLVYDNNIIDKKQEFAEEMGVVVKEDPQGKNKTTTSTMEENDRNMRGAGTPIQNYSEHEEETGIKVRKKQLSSSVPLMKKSLLTISEDEKSILSSRPNTPLTKSTGKSKKSVEGTKERQKKFEAITSTVTFKDIGGYQSSILEISKLILHLKHPEVFTHLGIQPPRGFLLHGAPGCGKTLFANAIAGELKIPFFKVASPEVVSGISGESEQNIRALFNEAKLCAPSILFIDEIDSITPKRENAGKEMERRVVTQILSCMDDLSATGSHVLVIGATNRIDALDPALRRAGRFDREIALGIPGRDARKSILQVICKNLRLSQNFNFDKIASCTPGFVGADLQALVREAAIYAVDRAFQDLREKEKIAVRLFAEDVSGREEKEHMARPVQSVGQSNNLADDCDTLAWLRDQPPLSDDQLKGLYITTEHFEEALPSVQPSAKREGFATVPDVTWEDVGALEDVRGELTMAIMAPVQNPEEFDALGLSTPPGILLAGPPGCGKTLLAKAIANEAGINFISVKGPELLNMYVGESEKAVRQVFVRARNSAPCVIFFDEIDALCPKRSQTGDSNVSSRVVNQLLTEMDGLEARKQVFIMGATNRPDILDGAILRPGRLDKLLYVGLPDLTDRIKILTKITKNCTKPRCGADVTMEKVARDCRSEGYSGADLNALVREASVAALKEFMLSRTKVDISDVNMTTSDVNISENLMTKRNDKNNTEIVTEKTGKNIDDKNTDEEKNTNSYKNSNDFKDMIEPTTSFKVNDAKAICLTWRHFEMAFEKVKPSVVGKDRDWYEKMKEKQSTRMK